MSTNELVTLLGFGAFGLAAYAISAVMSAREETTERQGTQCQGISGFRLPRRGFSTAGS